MRRKIVISAVTAALAVAVLPAAFAQRYLEWLPAEHLAEAVNTGWTEMNPVVSRDGLTLNFTRFATAGGPSPLIHFAAHRASEGEPWMTPVYLGEILGDGLFISTDGHRAYFSLKVNGQDDLFMARRQDKDDDLSWGQPEDLGPAINTAANESFPDIREDEATGETFLYFVSDRTGNEDIYVSRLWEDGTPSDPVPVTELNSASGERRVRIRRDGLECVVMSNRPGSMLNAQGKPSWDLWVATRRSTSEPWSALVNMGENVNTGKFEGAPYYSFDGSQLYFQAANRVGNFGDGCPNSATCYFDIWVTTRVKANGSRRE